MNVDAIQQLADEGADLIITVDCGVRRRGSGISQPVGMTLIVSDHHTPGKVLPPAFAIIDPKQQGDPIQRNTWLVLV